MEERFDGRYELLERLGSGESATVYLARDLARARRVALKLALDTGARGGERLRREFELLGQLNHPQLPAVHEFGHARANDQSYFTLDLFAGSSLDAAAPGLGEEDLVKLFAECCRLLAYLQRSGLVHGDLKPANLIVTRDAAERPSLRVIDLGLGGEPDEGRRGWIRGTPRYAAPSILAGDPPNTRTDLYAMGASFLDASGRWEGSTLEPRELAPAFLRVLERLVAHDPDTRYQAAEDVLGDLVREGFEVGSADSAGAVFVGRRDELERLRSLGEGLLDGGHARHLTFLFGFQGVGKSALLAELCRALELRDVVVVRTRARAEEGALACWATILHHLALLEPGGGTQRSAAVRDEWSRLDEEGRAEGMRRALERASERRPVLAVLDDAHLLDEASLRLLQALAGVREEARWMLVLGVQGAEESSEAEEQLRAISARHALFELELSGLPPDDADALIATVAPALTRGDRARIAEVTGGRPLFVEAAARAVLRRPDEPLDVAVHTGLHALLEARLARIIDGLAEEERSLAERLSVLVRPAPPTLAAAVVEQPVSAVDPLLRRLEERAVLEAVEAPDGRLFAFARGELRLALLQRLDPPQARRLHGRALVSWSELGAAGDGLAPVLLHHALEAEDTEAVLEHGPRAVESFLRDFAPRSARKTLTRLLTYLERHGRSPSLELLELEGDVYRRLGQLPAARACYVAARELCRGADVARGVTARLLEKVARTLEAAGEYERAHEALLEALRESDDPVRSARVHAALSIVYSRLGDPEAAERSLRDGLSELGDTASPQAAPLWNNLGVLAYDRADHAAAHAHWSRALSIYRASGDRARVGKALTNLGSVAMVLGRLEEAREAFEAASEIKREIGNQRSLATTLSNLAMLERWRGRFGRAIQLDEHVLRLRQEMEDAAGEARSNLSLSTVWLDKGELGRARHHAERAVAVARSTGEVDSVLIEALLATATVEKIIGRVDRAREIVDEALGIVRELGNRSEQARLHSLRATLLGKDPEADRDRARSLELMRAIGEPRGLGIVLLAAADHSLLRGAPEEARRQAREAGEIAERLGLPHLAGEVALVEGRLALWLQDVERASERLLFALARARELGTPEVEWRACAELARFHGEQGQRARAVGWLGNAVTVFQRVMATLGGEGELQEAYLAAPGRAEVLARLESLIEE